MYISKVWLSIIALLVVVLSIAVVNLSIRVQNITTEMDATILNLTNSHAEETESMARWYSLNSISLNSEHYAELRRCQ